ncbi:MAG: glycosyltransferase [Nitratireductor sp.]|nr:glycosyltransferase [Nitratireductor sp.]
MPGNKKNIAYVLSAFPVLSETFIGNEIRALEAQGHAILPMVFDLRQGPAQPADIELAGRVQRISGISAVRALAMLPLLWRAQQFAGQQKLLARRSLLWHALKIAAHARANNCSHIHAHFAGGAAAHAIAAARIAGLTVSFSCHGHDIYAEPEDLDAKFANTDAVVSVCNEMRDDLLAMGCRAPVAMIPCGTDPQGFRPRPRGRNDNGRLLFVGRLVPQKGLDDLFAAISLLSGRMSVQIDIVGDGPMRDYCEEQASRLALEGGHRIDLLGGRNSDWLKAHAPDYCGVCLPFKTAPDGSRDTGPLVVKEAMAMQLPVISTAYMGVKDTVTPETGILVEPGDPVALSKAIVKLATTAAQERQAMGTAGRKRVCDQFTLASQAKALSGLFRSLPGAVMP